MIDGGNLLFHKRQLTDDDRVQLLEKARVIIQGYNAIGVDAVALGPNDFAAGFEALEELRAAARFPFLCANIVHRDTGAPVYQPTAVVRRGGLSIGLIGVVDSALGARGLGPGGEGFRVEPLFSTVHRYADQLAADCDAVVVLSAVPMKKFRLLAKKIGSVDFFVAGDPQDKLRIPWTINGTMIASTTQLGKYLGYAKLEVGNGGAERETKHQFVPMKPECGDDPFVKRMVDGYYKYCALQRRQDPKHYEQDAEERVNLEYGKAVYVSAAECGRCHREVYQRWQDQPHAVAWQRLPGDSKDRSECLECHVTGMGNSGGFAAGSGENGLELTGVQCEACHGAGSLHPAVSLARTEQRQVTKVCRGCHTPSRSPDFRLREYLARIACTQVKQARVEPTSLPWRMARW